MGRKTQISLVAVVLTAALLVLVAYVWDSSRDDTIAEGVTIGGVDVGGLDVDAARSEVERNLLDPLIYLRSQELYTLALGLNLFRGVNFTAFNLLMAVSIITLIPVLVMFFLSQKLFVQGVTLTGMGGR